MCEEEVVHVPHTRRSPPQVTPHMSRALLPGSGSESGSGWAQDVPQTAADRLSSVAYGAWMEQSVALSGTQWHSVALNGTQWQSVALSGTQWHLVEYSVPGWSNQ